MPFNLEIWKQATSEKFHSLNRWLKRRAQNDVPYVAYGALCGAALLPAVEAAQQGQFLPVMMALGSVAGGVGGNLIAEQIQRWKDRADTLDKEQIAGWVDDNVNNSEVRAALDEVLTKLDAIPQAQAALSPDARAWFATELQRELKALGNFDRFEAVLIGSGLSVQGNDNVTAHKGGVAVKGDVQGPVITGGAYIAHQEVHPQEPASPVEPSPAARAEARYRQNLAQRCNVLPLAALGGEEDTAVDVGLDRVYIDLDTTTRVPIAEAGAGQKTADGRRQLNLDKEKERAWPALEAAAQEKRLVLLGDPGSGKSTFVRQLSVWLAQGKALDGWEPGLTPMLTTLRDLAPRLAGLTLHGVTEAESQQRLLDAVWEQWRADLHLLRADDYAAALEDCLSDGRAVLIFDGLDEVPERVRLRVRAAVRTVLQAYPQVARVIVTCRIRSYAGAAILPGFAAQTLAPFDENKVKAFVRAWYRAQADLHQRFDRDTAETRAADLQQAALSTDLRELSSNPMLLTTMAIIHQREVGLPRERVRLYSLAVQVLISRWQKRKGIAVSDQLASVLSDDLRLRAILERVAYETHRLQSARGHNVSEHEADLSRRDLLALLEAPEYLDEAGLASEWVDYVDQRAGLLVGRGGAVDGHKPQTYTFPHRTFQEYLAGCYMISGRGVAREYWQRAAEGDYWYLAARLGAEELLFMRRNTKELLDLAYDLCPEREPREIQEWRAALWSGQLAALLKLDDITRDEGRPGGGTAYLQRLRPRLIEVLGHPTLKPIERAAAGRVLGRLGDPRPEVMTVDALEFCYVPAGPFWRGSQDDPQAYDGEKPQSKVDLDHNYWLSRYPITNAQFKEFVDAGGYGEARYWVEAQADGAWDAGQVIRHYTEFENGRFSEIEERGVVPHHFGENYSLPNHPVVGVTWYEALAFTRWLTENWQQTGRLRKSQIVRLPRENEWEKAARGGLKIPATPLIGWLQAQPPVTLIDNPLPRRRYPWGDEIDRDRVNYDEAGIGLTSAPGCFATGVSPYGAQDLSGNVWEWCATKWQDNYENYKDDNDLSGTDGRVLRGGSFHSNVRNVRCAFRFRFDPFNRDRNLGFRICVSSPF